MERNDSGSRRDHPETRPRRDGEGFAAKLKGVLKSLGAEELADVASAVAREQRRRAKQKDPADMNDSQHHAWVADEIRKASRAGKENADG